MFIERFTTNDSERIHLPQTRSFLPTFDNRCTIHFRRRYTTTRLLHHDVSNFIYKSSWNLPFKATPRAGRDPWTTRLRVFIRSLSPIPEERTSSQLWARSSSQFFPSVSLVSDRLLFWINRNRKRSLFFYAKMDDIDDCLSSTRHFESVLFTLHEI